ncbi:MAG: SDR family NAD(P)-dependent oxidoreductase [Gemmatimonadota bacterium]
MELSGIVAMISGGTQGLGLALARRFGEEGAAVSICGRDAGKLARTLHMLREEGLRCAGLATDVTDDEQVGAWFAETAKAFGDIHVLVNNASILGPRAPISAYEPEHWRQVIEVNLTGAYLCARAAIEPLTVTRGSMIHVSSGVGDHGRPYWGAYSASKNGLEALSQILAGELEEVGIRSNVVDPGAMRTEMRAAAYPDEDPATLPAPAQIADVFVYLASQDSADTTGQRFRARDFERP